MAKLFSGFLHSRQLTFYLILSIQQMALIKCRIVVISLTLFTLSSAIQAQMAQLRKQINQVSDSLYQILEFQNNDTAVIGTLSSLNPEVKNGNFIFYDQGHLMATGQYTGNCPSGVWTYFNPEGEKINQVNYDSVIDFLRTDTVSRPDANFIVEDMPTFENGDITEFRTYISDHLVYPAYSKLRGSEGRVFISYIVNEKGKVSNVKIVRKSGDFDIDMEAIRVIAGSPQWRPGTIQGKPVSVVFTHPIVFSLATKTPSKNGGENLKGRSSKVKK